MTAAGERRLLLSKGTTEWLLPVRSQQSGTTLPSTAASLSQPPSLSYHPDGKQLAEMRLKGGARFPCDGAGAEHQHRSDPLRAASCCFTCLVWFLHARQEQGARYIRYILFLSLPCMASGWRSCNTLASAWSGAIDANFKDVGRPSSLLCFLVALGARLMRRAELNATSRGAMSKVVSTLSTEWLR